MYNRKDFIGGSDIASICGFGFKTPLEIYYEKVNGAKEDDINKQNIFERGKILEPFVKKLFENKSNNIVSSCNEIITHDKYKFIKGTIDGYINDTNTIVEFKTALNFTRKFYGEENTDEIKTAYLLQGAWYLMLLPKANTVLFPILFGNENEFSLIIKQIKKYGIDETIDNFSDYDLNFKIYKSERNEKLQEKLLNIGVDFFTNNIQKLNPPNCTNFDDIKLLFNNEIKDSKVEADNDDLILINEFKEKTNLSKALEKQIEEIKTKLCSKVGNSSFMIDQDKKIILSWKTQNRSFLNQKKLDEENPNFLNKYFEQKQYRVLKVY